MKLLICAHDRPDSVNGPNIWLQRLLPELRKEGIESELLFFPVGNPERCPTLQSLQNDGFSCEIYSGRRFTEHKMRWILKKVKSNPPDIFVPNLNIPAYYASKLIKKAGIPTIGVLHSDDSFYRSIVEEFITDTNDDYLSAIVCVSKFLENYVRDHSKEELLIRRIHYGVPIPEEKAQFDHSKFRLIYAGRLIERQKRISDVTKSLCQLTNEIPDTEAVLYGSGPAEEDITQIINENKNSNVRLGGLVDNDELKSRYLENQVFVLLSDYEGLPIALMEAMASSLVPICYDMDSGIPELITDGKNGLIVEDRDQSFYKAINRLKEDKQLWESCSHKARRKIEQEYSIQNMKDQWKRLLEEIVENNTQKEKKVDISVKFDLPPRNPSIREFEDMRWPGYVQFYKSRVTNLIKRFTRVS